MRAHFLQHVPFEGPGSIEQWLNKTGYQITTTQLFDSEKFPEPSETDFLVILGGPMSVNDENQFSWLIHEKEFIRQVINLKTPVLGVCLGAQLIANSVGSKVYPNGEKEIGWFPVEGVSSGSSTAFQFPESFQCFHWHGETFDLPPEAIHLAKTEACKNQAFQIGESVIGLQFHLETTAESAKKIVENCRNELILSRYVQPEERILSATDEEYEHIHSLMEQILSFLHKRMHHKSR